MAILTVNAEFDVESATLGRLHAIAEIYPQADETQDDSMLEKPVTLQPDRHTEIADLPEGEYVVQLRLPTGRRATKTVTIADGEEHRLTFDLRRLPAPTASVTSADVQKALVMSRDLRPALSVLAPDDPADDLMKIRGVGPVLAKVLIDRGVNSAFDVARMSKRELGWLGESATSIIGTVRKFDIIEGAADVVFNTDTDLGNRGIELGFASGLQTGGYGTDPTTNFVQEAWGVPAVFEGLGESADRPLAFDDYPVGDTGAGAVPAARLSPFFLEEAEEEATSVWKHIEASDDPDADAQSDENLVERFGQQNGELVSIHSTENGDVSKISVDKFEGIQPTVRESSRLHAIINDGYVSWLAPLPLPWRSPGRLRECSLSIVADRSTPWMTSVSMMPKDPVIGGLFEFLSSGDAAATLAILDGATERLYGKMRNPFAAAAGALVLVQSKRWAPQALDKRAGLGSSAMWEEWVGNLCRRQSWLPDGFILQAWLELLGEQSSDDLARRNLLTAVRLGLPTYSGCFGLLVEGLRTLQSRSGKNDPELDHALQHIDAAALRIDLRQVFTIVRLTDPPPRKFTA